MEERIEDEDGDILASLSTVLPSYPHRKTQSYSQQSTISGSHNFRKHSFDDNQIPKNLSPFYDSSDDDDEFFSGNTTSSFSPSIVSNNTDTGNDLHEYMRQLLDLKPPEIPEQQQQQKRSLPEFVASGGGNGIFKVPLRAAMHPGRPPSLELRPHPLRETQIGWFLRTIACTETQLWVGQESGVRFWNFEDAYSPGCGIGGKSWRGDEDSARFHASVPTSQTLCLIVDSGNRFVWSGHKDGKIRSWKMDQSLDGNSFREGLTWQAHRGPVLSMVMTSYGIL